jgi:starch phosphorylase
MKAGMNGVLNLSSLDGWWPEGFNGENGWAITAGDYYDNPEMRDLAEANQIYDYLEEEISSLYFQRDDEDIPVGWVTMMKKSIFTIAQGFSIERMLRDYEKLCYEPSLKTAAAFAEGNRQALKEMVGKALDLRQHWPALQIQQVQTDIEKRRTLFAGDPIEMACRVFLDGIDPDDVQAQVRYRVSKDSDIVVIPLEPDDGSTDGVFTYSGKVHLRPSGLQELDVVLVPADKTIRKLYPNLAIWAQ